MADRADAGSPCMHAQWPQLCPCLWDPMDYSPPGSSVHGTDSPGKNTGWVAMPSPGDLPDPGAEPGSLSVYPHWQAGSLPLAPPGKPLRKSLGLL